MTHKRIQLNIEQRKFLQKCLDNNISDTKLPLMTYSLRDIVLRILRNKCYYKNMKTMTSDMSKINLIIKWYKNEKTIK